MKTLFKLGVPAATFVVAAFLGTMTASPASAGEYCRTDVTGHMTSCGFDTMAQCQAAASGIGGDCFRDPKLQSSAGNSFAYQPDGNTTRPVRRGRSGRAANPQ